MNRPEISACLWLSGDHIYAEIPTSNGPKGFKVTNDVAGLDMIVKALDAMRILGEMTPRTKSEAPAYDKRKVRRIKPKVKIQGTVDQARDAAAILRSMGLI